MSVIIFILLVVLTVTFFAIFISSVNEEGAGFAGGIGLVLLVAGFGFPYYSLNSDVHTVLTEAEYIEMEKEYIVDLRKQLDSFPEFEAALLNKDTPVATITASLHEAQRTLRERKVTILNAKRNIKERENGLTSYIFWFYSDDLLEEANRS